MNRFLVAFDLAIFILVASSGFGQSIGFPACSSTPPNFCADMCSFKEGQGYSVEVYLLVCNSDVQFVRNPAGFEARANASVVLMSGKKQVNGDTKLIRFFAKKYDETTSVDTCNVVMIPLNAQAGNLRAIINLMDLESRARSTVDVNFTLESIDSVAGISDIVLLRSKPDFNAPRWNGYEPLVKRRLDMRDTNYAFYYELYLADRSDTMFVRHILRSENGDVVKEWDRAIYGCSVCGRLEFLECDSLTNGTYTIDVSLLSGERKQLAKRSKQFEVLSVSFYFDRDIDGAIALLSYIATGHWISEFRKADAERRRKLWEEFWREKDPNPATPKNEFFEEHVRRFEYTNRNFSTSLVPGWQTDRGRIYILNGEPDEIEKYSGDVTHNPAEIWYYYARGKRFIFVDETGFGDYVLVSDR